MYYVVFIRAGTKEPKMTRYEIVHDKVRIQADSARQWLVYVDGRLRAECTSKQAAKDFVAIQKARD
jgi:hypothetical protein